MNQFVGQPLRVERQRSTMASSTDISLQSSVKSVKSDDRLLSVSAFQQPENKTTTVWNDLFLLGSIHSLKIVGAGNILPV